MVEAHSERSISIGPCGQFRGNPQIVVNLCCVEGFSNATAKHLGKQRVVHSNVRLMYEYVFWPNSITNFITYVDQADKQEIIIYIFTIYLA